MALARNLSSVGRKGSSEDPLVTIKDSLLSSAIFLNRKRITNQLGTHPRESRLLMDDADGAQDRDIVVCGESQGARFGVELEPVRERKFLVCLRVVVRTVGLLAGVAVETLLDFKKVRVELLFLPAVARGTPVLQKAAVLIGGNEVLGVPVLTHLLRIGEDRGLAPVVLPVVRIHADVTFVVVLSVRTPDGLKMEKIEVHVWLKLLYKLNGELFFTVSERTEFSVVTLMLSVEIGGAELGLVLVRVIELLHAIVSAVTAFIVRALLVVIDVPALLRLVDSKLSPSILLEVVIIRALLEVMRKRVNCTGLSLEKIEVQEGHTLGHSYVLSSIRTVLLHFLLRKGRLSVRHWLLSGVLL